MQSDYYLKEGDEDLNSVIVWSSLGCKELIMLEAQISKKKVNYDTSLRVSTTHNIDGHEIIFDESAT